MKTYVITLSKRFLAGHPRAGQPTDFFETFEFYGEGGILMHKCDRINPHKKHTIRANYPLWAKRIAEVERGEACLSIRQWTDKPYRSKQVEIARRTKEDGVGIQRIDLSYHADSDTITAQIDGKEWLDADCYEIAKNDGLYCDDWKEWFKGYDLAQPMAIIHFTEFRY